MVQETKLKITIHAKFAISCGTQNNSNVLKLTKFYNIYGKQYTEARNMLKGYGRGDPGHAFAKNMFPLRLTP